MKDKTKKTIFISLSIILFLLIFLLSFNYIFNTFFSNQIYPNVYFNNINMGGLTKEEAAKIISEKIQVFENSGIKIELKNRQIIWHNTVSSFDPDLAYQSVVFNVDSSVDKMYLLGRQGNIKDIFFKLKSLFFKTQIGVDFLIEKEILSKFLNDNFSDLTVLANDAKLSFVEENGKIVFFITPENSGKEIDFNIFFKDMEENIKNLKTDTIELSLVDKIPTIIKDNVVGIENEAQLLLELIPKELIYEEKNKTFIIDNKTFASWLCLKNKFFQDKIIGVEISLSDEEISKYFDDKIKDEVNQEPILPKFEFKDNKVTSFESGKDGLKINYEQSIKNIKEAFEKRNMDKIPLLVEIDPVPKIDSINELGIESVIGTGHSNFAGSSANRRHNIKTGASKINGLIIKPGEEFSLLKALGETDASAGYLPELVIKGDKTTLEYGGGLCQIATTMFRTALATGLPITERRNHSYRVSYYEPAGTDATIYIPNPDLKFINDTGNNILIQTRFEGDNDVYFDFWGKSDGRIVSSTVPVIFNIVKPAPTKIVETTELPVGQKKCTESAHNGAQTYFDYTVIYSPETENEKKVVTRFNSKYVPWQAVCLLGVEKLSTTTATSSTSTILTQ
jgi:vancomycin resistance protein YoaR